jgi:hypothetical protein
VFTAPFRVVGIDQANHRSRDAGVRLMRIDSESTLSSSEERSTFLRHCDGLASDV